MRRHGPPHPTEGLSGPDLVPPGLVARALIASRRRERLTAAVAIGVIMLAPVLATACGTTTDPAASSTSGPSGPSGTDSPGATATVPPAAGEPSMPDGVDGPYRLDRVVDGDTLRFLDDAGRSVSVRLIGIDTPETKDPRKPVQCFGEQASAQATAWATPTVWLETDPTQGATDRYDRRLAYVWTADRRMLNWRLVQGGFAHEYTYDLPYRYQSEFRAAQRSAREAQRGLWSPSTCGGDTSQPA